MSTDRICSACAFESRSSPVPERQRGDKTRDPESDEQPRQGARPRPADDERIRGDLPEAAGDLDRGEDGSDEPDEPALAGTHPEGAAKVGHLADFR